MISPSGHYLRSRYLKHLADTCRDVYKQAKPFPHLVIDEFLPAAILDRVLDEFPKATAFDWQTTDGNLESKSTPKPEQNLGKTTYKLIQQLNSPGFIRFLETLTDTREIIADPVLMAGSFGNALLPATSPKRSMDAHRYAKQHFDRKLNLLIYLNKNWKEEYGGHLELWNAEMTHCEKRILPSFNRCVIFSTTDFSYHGHPEPLNCPEGESRKLLALSYYSRSSDRPQLHQSRIQETYSPLSTRLIPEGHRKPKNNVLAFRTNPSPKG